MVHTIIYYCSKFSRRKSFGHGKIEFNLRAQATYIFCIGKRVAYFADTRDVNQTRDEDIKTLRDMSNRFRPDETRKFSKDNKMKLCVHLVNYVLS